MPFHYMYLFSMPNICVVSVLGFKNRKWLRCGQFFLINYSVSSETVSVETLENTEEKINLIRLLKKALIFFYKNTTTISRRELY